MHSWQNHFLSQVGKEILIKTVIQAILTYTICVFKLLKKLCDKYNQMMIRFWWGFQKQSKKIRKVKWKKLKLSKSDGGMGFRDIECFNQVMLAKQGWRFIMNSLSLAT